MFKREIIEFTGVDKMPAYWHPYFSMSVVGNKYEILYKEKDDNGKGETLIMSDTEYEYYTNQPFLDKVKVGHEVLSIGYGIGLIIPEVKKKGANLTIIEKYKKILDLENNLDSDVHIVLGDINTIDFEKYFPTKKFDIIFSDTSEINNRLKSLEKVLKPDGEMILWKHITPKN